MNNKNLSELALGEGGTVSALDICGSMRRRLLDVGLSPGTEVFCVGKSPLGDPHLFFVRGTLIAIRKRDAKKIILN
jgi:ferrous iron transport protein A